MVLLKDRTLFWVTGNRPFSYINITGGIYPWMDRNITVNIFGNVGLGVLSKEELTEILSVLRELKISIHQVIEYDKQSIKKKLISPEYFYVTLPRAFEIDVKISYSSLVEILFELRKKNYKTVWFVTPKTMIIR